MIEIGKQGKNSIAQYSCSFSIIDNVYDGALVVYISAQCDGFPFSVRKKQRMS